HTLSFAFFSRPSKHSPPGRTRGGRPSRPRAPVQLLLERLEDRTVPSVAVTRLSDSKTFTTIQAAINDAGTTTGTVLQGSPGTDSEQVDISKSIIWEGAQHGVDARTRTGSASTETIMDASGNGGTTPFHITASNVTIDGFTVENVTSSTVFGFGIL